VSSTQPIEITCSRCGKPADSDQTQGWPWGWEGTASEAVCPDCQFCTWHPHCLSLVDREGKRVDPSIDWASMPPAERDYSGLSRCEHIDLSVPVLDVERDWPERWTCPRCGGTEFELVHRDYEASGLAGAGFVAELTEPDDEDDES